MVIEGRDGQRVQRVLSTLSLGLTVKLINFTLVWIINLIINLSTFKLDRFKMF